MANSRQTNDVLPNTEWKPTTASGNVAKSAILVPIEPEPTGPPGVKSDLLISALSGPQWIWTWCFQTCFCILHHISPGRHKKDGLCNRRINENRHQLQIFLWRIQFQVRVKVETEAEKKPAMNSYQHLSCFYVKSVWHGNKSPFNPQRNSKLSDCTWSSSSSGSPHPVTGWVRGTASLNRVAWDQEHVDGFLPLYLCPGCSWNSWRGVPPEVRCSENSEVYWSWSWRSPLLTSPVFKLFFETLLFSSKPLKDTIKPFILIALNWM